MTGILFEIIVYECSQLETYRETLNWTKIESATHIFKILVHKTTNIVKLRTMVVPYEKVSGWTTIYNTEFRF